MEPESKKELRSRMKRVMKEFAAIECLNEEEESARADLEKVMREIPRSWEFLCGMAEGINVLTRMYPFATQDITFRLVARLVMIVTSKIGLEVIQEDEDEESFPEEI